MTNDLHHLAAAYTLDALDDAERQAFEAHYPSCEICSQEVVDFRETASALAGAVAMAPPDELKQRVMAEVARTRQLPPMLPDSVIDLAERRRRRAGRPIMLAAAAAAIVAIVGIVGAIRLGSESDLEELIAAPDAVVIDLPPNGEVEGVSGSMRVVWSPERDRVAVIGDGISDAGAGMEYALWFLTPDGVAPAGLFAPSDGRVRAIIDVEDIDGVGWGVTIEPDGGSEQPTSDVLYLGTA